VLHLEAKHHVGPLIEQAVTSTPIEEPPDRTPAEHDLL
jgi:hypothetical protein